MDVNPSQQGYGAAVVIRYPERQATIKEIEQGNGSEQKPRPMRSLEETDKIEDGERNGHHSQYVERGNRNTHIALKGYKYHPKHKGRQQGTSSIYQKQFLG